jgi:hypothetical protein
MTRSSFFNSLHNTIGPLELFLQGARRLNPKRFASMKYLRVSHGPHAYCWSIAAAHREMPTYDMPVVKMNTHEMLTN